MISTRQLRRTLGLTHTSDGLLTVNNIGSHYYSRPRGRKITFSPPASSRKNASNLYKEVSWLAEPELPTGALKLQVLENASMENTSTEKSRSHNVPLEILSELQQRHCAYSRITASQKRISHASLLWSKKTDSSSSRLLRNCLRICSYAIWKTDRVCITTHEQWRRRSNHGHCRWKRNS